MLDFNKDEYVEKVNKLSHDEIKEHASILGVEIMEDCEEEDFEEFREVLRGEKSVDCWLRSVYYEEAEDDVKPFVWIEVIQSILK